MSYPINVGAGLSPSSSFTLDMSPSASPASPVPTQGSYGSFNAKLSHDEQLAEYRASHQKIKLLEAKNKRMRSFITAELAAGVGVHHQAADLENRVLKVENDQQRDSCCARCACFVCGLVTGPIALIGSLFQAGYRLVG